MNGWGKKIGIAIAALTMISTVYLLVADGRYFPLREGDAVAGGMKSIVKALKFTEEALKKQAEETKDLKNKYYEEKSDRQQRKIEDMQRKIRRLETRPRAQ